MPRRRMSMKSKNTGGRVQKRSNKRPKGKLGVPDLKNLDNNKFYCFKCGVVKCKGVKMDSKKMPNGCSRLVGMCPQCNSKVMKVLPKNMK